MSPFLPSPSVAGIEPVRPPSPIHSTMDASIANAVGVVVDVVVLYRSSLHNLGLRVGPAKSAPVKVWAQLNAAR